MNSKRETNQKTNTTQQQTSKPLIDPRIEGAYMDVLGLTQSAVNGLDRTPWTGSAVAGGNQYDQQSILETDAILKALSSNFTPGTFSNIALDAASGRLMDPSTNPTLQGMIDASISPITEKLNRQVIPGLDNASIMDNAFGGDRAQLMKGQAYGDWAESAGNIAAGINYDNYTRERQNQLNAAQLWEQALSAETLIPSMYGQLGDYQRQLDQYAIDDKIMQRALQEQIAFAGLNQATGILNAIPMVGQQSQGSSQSTGTTTETTKQNPVTSLVQAGLGLGSMMSGLGWTPFASAAAQAPNVRKIGFGMDTNALLAAMKGLG